MAVGGAELSEWPHEWESVEVPATPTRPASSGRFLQKKLLFGPAVEVEGPLAVGGVHVVAGEALVWAKVHHLPVLVLPQLAESEGEDVTSPSGEERSVRSLPREQLVLRLGP